uniref:Small ribosomal subunit protein uS11c n=1 Tax=Olisthodiscus luteus TaxID=83000 RepID=A0A7U0QG31_OLILU|nr:ribosomal protein S11 [Olisthodiscus luteus]QQW50576.1 ribosomal protein S11 [Olisthodiscus luteus]
MAKITKRSSKKIKRNVPTGIAHINSTSNNTIVTISDLNGNTIAFASAGSSGFKGTRKSTTFATQIAAENATLKAIDQGMKNIEVWFKGQSSGRETAVRAIANKGLRVISIVDRNGVPHNGCRKPRRRRV